MSCDASALTGQPAADEPGALPDWLAPLAAAAATATAADLAVHRQAVPPGARPAAVLVLLGYGQDGPDVLLTERSADLRAHAGQPAFPGGSTDPGDASPAATALREAGEEVGLDPAGVQLVATLPALYIGPSGFAVTPVLAWWRSPSAVGPADPAETAAVERVPLAELADPANRVRVRHARTGWVGPAFTVRGLLVWGFTAGLLDALLRLGGWEQPWRPGRLVELPALPGTVETAVPPTSREDVS